MKIVIKEILSERATSFFNSQHLTWYQFLMLKKKSCCFVLQSFLVFYWCLLSRGKSCWNKKFIFEEIFILALLFWVHVHSLPWILLLVFTKKCKARFMKEKRKKFMSSFQIWKTIKKVWKFFLERAVNLLGFWYLSRCQHVIMR